MILRRAFAAVAAALAFAQPAQALAPSPRTMSSMQALDVLEEVVRATGTDVQVIACTKPNLYGFYQYDVDNYTGEVTDRIVLCKNGPIDWTNPRSALETLQHEATHVAQACSTGGAIYNHQTHMWMLDQLPADDLHSLTGYEDSALPYEIEAFYFENQQAEVVIDLVLENCSKQIEARRRSLT